MARSPVLPSIPTLLATRLFPSPQLQAIYDLYTRVRRATRYALQIAEFGAYQTVPVGLTSTSLGRLVQKAATPPLKGTYLYLFVRRQRPQTILELGTHVGIGTLYLHAAAPEADLHTIEASETLAIYAKRHFALLGARVRVHVGLFQEVLPRLEQTWDLIYIDGDHRGMALQAYVRQLYPCLREGGWLVCDDIYWSRDMWRSWRTIRREGWRYAATFYPFGFLQK